MHNVTSIDALRLQQIQEPTIVAAFGVGRVLIEDCSDGTLILVIGEGPAPCNYVSIETDDELRIVVRGLMSVAWSRGLVM